jgi:hypothetical protein
VAEIKMRVCDVDPIPGEKVRTYDVTVEGHRKRLDLCDRHAGPFAPEQPVRRSAARTEPPRATPEPKPRGTRRKVTTMAEIEAMKG